MGKLNIAKSKTGGYYSKIINNRANCSMMVTVNLPRGVDISVPYGTFDCDYYLSCYQSKSGDVVLVIKVTKINDQSVVVTNPEINPSGTSSVNAYEDYNNSTPELPF